EKGKDDKPTKKMAGSEWGQVVKLPDGTLSYHELPELLVQVLENPTPENIRAYFDWRMEKAGKVLRAAQLMKEYRESVTGTTERSANPAALVRAVSSGEAPGGSPTPPRAAPSAQQGRKSTPFTVTYFHRKNCPHCDTEDQILTEWLRDKPEGRLDVVEFGMMPELWRALKIRGTPSLLLEDPATKRRVFLEGVSGVQALDQAIEECHRTEAGNGTAKGNVGK
ncbi:MAG TPA: thioredoxin family protein, partial [Planctomycetota bacterium]|nr:thioredoxin family protein [Planctomycetota bacterium]